MRCGCRGYLKSPKMHKLGMYNIFTCSFMVGAWVVWHVPGLRGKVSLHLRPRKLFVTFGSFLMTTPIKKSADLLTNNPIYIETVMDTSWFIHDRSLSQWTNHWHFSYWRVHLGQVPPRRNTPRASPDFDGSSSLFGDPALITWQVVWGGFRINQTEWESENWECNWKILRLLRTSKSAGFFVGLQVGLQYVMMFFGTKPVDDNRWSRE